MTTFVCEVPEHEDFRPILERLRRAASEDYRAHVREDTRLVCLALERFVAADGTLLGEALAARATIDLLTANLGMTVEALAGLVGSRDPLELRRMRTMMAISGRDDAREIIAAIDVLMEHFTPQPSVPR